MLEALGEFDRACQAFSRGMARITEPANPALRDIIRQLGAPRRARRAEARATNELLKSNQ